MDNDREVLVFIQDFIDEYTRWRTAGEKAMAQVSDEALNRALAQDSNSIATIARHIGGNLRSRFTDFLTSDGEKPWRDRDSEFEEGPFGRTEVEAAWRGGFDTVARALAALTDDDLGRKVTVRGVELTVHEALCRNIAHTANHVGQIVLLARMFAGREWKTLSIPRGQSQAYNRSPVAEHAAGHAQALEEQQPR